MIAERMAEHEAVLQGTKALEPLLAAAGSMVSEALLTGHKILFCGNGGSAADAQHMAAEIMGRFQAEREPYPALALTVDTSVLTAIGNDYGYEAVFSRQVRGLGREGDVLVGISTSGTSRNVLAALAVAKKMGLKCLGFSGAKSEQMASFCDICLAVPSTVTARVQEMHIMMGHILCEIAETAIVRQKK